LWRVVIVAPAKETYEKTFDLTRFHDGLVETLAAVAKILRKRTSLNTVCLSGGTFQNACLANGLEHQLQSDGFEVYTHSQVSAGDGGSVSAKLLWLHIA
jgi:hydrogenase maturation factor HypF (carbamoyltransferase family)